MRRTLKKRGHTSHIIQDLENEDTQEILVEKTPLKMSGLPGLIGKFR